MWKPISEAKKDGTVYLLETEQGWIELGSWKQDQNVGEFIEINEEVEDDGWVGEEGWFSECGDDWSTGYYYTPLTPVRFLDFRGIEGYVPRKN